MSKPHPIPVDVKCSECGLPWDEYGDKPTLEDCVRPLRAELARRPLYAQYIPYPRPLVSWTTTTSAPSIGKATFINMAGSLNP